MRKMKKQMTRAMRWEITSNRRRERRREVRTEVRRELRREMR